jgi:hypothetical protein
MAASIPEPRPSAGKVAPIAELCAAGDVPQRLPDSPCAKEKDEESRPDRLVPVLVRHDLGEPREHIVRRGECTKQWFSNVHGYADPVEARHRIGVQFGSEDIVCRDSLGECDQTAQLPLEASGKTRPPGCLRRRNGIGVESSSERRVSFQRRSELRELAVRQRSLDGERPITRERFRDRALSPCHPIARSRLRQPQQAHESLMAVQIPFHPSDKTLLRQPFFL